MIVRSGRYSGEEWSGGGGGSEGQLMAWSQIRVVMILSTSAGWMIQSKSVVICLIIRQFKGSQMMIYFFSIPKN